MIEWVGAPVRFRESGRGIPDCFISLVCFGSSSRRGPMCWGRIYVEGLAVFFPCTAMRIKYAGFMFQRFAGFDYCGMNMRCIL